jgi:hypothetical protein
MILRGGSIKSGCDNSLAPGKNPEARLVFFTGHDIPSLGFVVNLAQAIGACNVAHPQRLPMAAAGLPASPGACWNRTDEALPSYCYPAYPLGFRPACAARDDASCWRLTRSLRRWSRVPRGTEVRSVPAPRSFPMLRVRNNYQELAKGGRRSTTKARGAARQ